MIARLRAPIERKRVSWTSLGVADYDRMSVLASELNARDGRICFI